MLTEGRVKNCCTDNPDVFNTGYIKILGISKQKPYDIDVEEGEYREVPRIDNDTQ